MMSDNYVYAHPPIHQSTNYQPVPPFTDPVPLSINQYRPLLTQCHQIQTSTTDPVTQSTNSYRPMLTHILKPSLVIWSVVCGVVWCGMVCVVWWGGWVGGGCVCVVVVVVVCV